MARSVNGRGRAVPAARAPLRPFYILLSLIAIGGIGLLIITWRTTPPVAPPPSAISVAEAVRPLIAPTGTTADGFAYKGDPSAPVKVIAYADFQCPACGNAVRLLEPTIDLQYVETGKVQFIYHDFPLDQHVNAFPAAEAARCAAAQNAFWPMHDLLFSRQREWATDRAPDPRFTSYAGELSLDQGAFAQCLAADTTLPALQQALVAAQQQAIQATPTYVVNGQVVAADQLQPAIDAALAAGGR